MNLSTNFTLEEMVRSQTALRLGIDNTPNASQIAHMTVLCASLLEPARTLLGVPLHIDSGFRSTRLNAAVGGAANSAHLDGRAADIVPIGLELHAAFDTLRHSDVPYDQIITECDAWIHIAIAADGTKPRRQMLAAKGHAGAWTYEAVE